MFSAPLQTLIMWQWLHTSASVTAFAPSIYPAGYFRKKTESEKDRGMFRHAAFLMCNQCTDMSPSVISPLRLFSVFCHKACVTNRGCAFATWTRKEPHRTNLVGLNTQGWKHSPGGRQCEQTREKRASAKFVSSRRGVSGKAVIQQYSGPLWEERIHGELRSVGGKADTTDGEIQRAPLCCGWVTGRGGVWDGCIFKSFGGRVVLFPLVSGRWQLSYWLISFWSSMRPFELRRGAFLPTPSKHTTH